MNQKICCMLLFPTVYLGEEGMSWDFFLKNTQKHTHITLHLVFFISIYITFSHVFLNQKAQHHLLGKQ